MGARSEPVEGANFVVSAVEPVFSEVMMRYRVAIAFAGALALASGFGLVEQHVQGQAPAIACDGQFFAHHAFYQNLNPLDR